MEKNIVLMIICIVVHHITYTSESTMPSFGWTQESTRYMRRNITDAKEDKMLADRKARTKSEQSKTQEPFPLLTKYNLLEPCPAGSNIFLDDSKEEFSTRIVGAEFLSTSPVLRSVSHVGALRNPDDIDSDTAAEIDSHENTSESDLYEYSTNFDFEDSTVLVSPSRAGTPVCSPLSPHARPAQFKSTVLAHIVSNRKSQMQSPTLLLEELE